MITGRAGKPHDVATCGLTSSAGLYERRERQVKKQVMIACGRWASVGIESLNSPLLLNRLQPLPIYASGCCIVGTFRETSD